MSKVSLSEFPIIPANKAALAHRKLVRGVATNDAVYMTTQTVGGKLHHCPYYTVWAHMLNRCYSSSYHKERPTYIGCSVCPEWLLFSIFREWMTKQDWRGKSLDKDTLYPGNKIYSPKTCLFVTNKINGLFLSSPAKRGDWPLGVCFDKNRSLFIAKIRMHGKHYYIGGYNTPEKAEAAYRLVKSKHIIRIAKEQTDPLRSGLLRHAALIAGNLFIKTRAALSA